MKHKTVFLTLFACLSLTPFLTFAQERPLPPEVSYVAKVHILDQAKEIALNKTDWFSTKTSVCKDYLCAVQLFSFMYGLNEGLVLKHIALHPFSDDSDYLDIVKRSFLALKKNDAVKQAIATKLTENCEQFNFNEKMKSDCIASILIDNYALFGYYMSSEYVDSVIAESGKESDK